MKLLVIRPEPGNARTVAAIREAGIEAIACPMFVGRPVHWQIDPSRKYDAVLAGSANAFRLGGDGLAQLTDLPVYAVGRATAVAAEAAGFSVAQIGTGGLGSLLPILERDGRRSVLRLAGRERVGLPVFNGSLATHIVYEMKALDLPLDIASQFRDGGAIALHSAAAARHFREQCTAHALDISRLTILSLGSRISDAAGMGWKASEICDMPDDDAMLALAKRICQKAKL